jgi:hypothetical protein
LIGIDLIAAGGGWLLHVAGRTLRLKLKMLCDGSAGLFVADQRVVGTTLAKAPAAVLGGGTLVGRVAVVAASSAHERVCAVLAAMAVAAA